MSSSRFSLDVPPAGARAAQRARRDAPRPPARWRRYRTFWLAAVLGVWAFALEARTVGHDFTFWDDDVYVTHNALIQELSVARVYRLFSSFSNCNYHPLTSLTHMFEYALVGPSPWLYHLGNVLLHAAAAVVCFLLSRRVLGSDAGGFLAAQQSFGSLLNHHPHLHALSSLGVFTRDGVFHPAPEDIDFSPLEDLFREEVFRSFLKKEKITPERVEFLRSWRHSGFNVNSDRRGPQGDRLELERLLQYMERPPVSLKRLEYRDDGTILYRGNYNPSLGRDYQFCSPLEFLAMLVPHVALRHECRIHSYGAISTTIRRQLGWIEKKEDGDGPDGPGEVVVLEDEESEFVKLRRKNWARLIAKVYLDNPALCNGCGQEMKVISALTSPHQDDVIGRMLRHRGQWDPPWKRDRKIRGPPRQLDIVTHEEGEFSQLRPEVEDEFSQVPPGDGIDL